MTDNTRITASLAVFDLDGTLMASDNTIFTAMDITLNKMNIPHTVTREKLLPMIGAHFQDVFDAFGVTVPDLEEYLTEYKQVYYSLLHLSILYDGIEDVLKTLQSRGFTLALLTTKGQEQAERILQEFNLTQYFSFISGRKPGREVKPSPEPLFEICRHFSVPVTDCVMIGDSEYDTRCGKNAGAQTLAVAYGYRSETFLRNEAPDALVFSAREIPVILHKK